MRQWMKPPSRKLVSGDDRQRSDRPGNLEKRPARRSSDGSYHWSVYCLTLYAGVGKPSFRLRYTVDSTALQIILEDGIPPRMFAAVVPCDRQGRAKLGSHQD